MTEDRYPITPKRALYLAGFIFITLIPVYMVLYILGTNEEIHDNEVKINKKERVDKSHILNMDTYKNDFLSPMYLQSMATANNTQNKYAYPKTYKEVENKEPIIYSSASDVPQLVSEEKLKAVQSLNLDNPLLDAQIIKIEEKLKKIEDIKNTETIKGVQIANVLSNMTEVNNPEISSFKFEPPREVIVPEKKKETRKEKILIIDEHMQMQHYNKNEQWSSFN